MHPCISSLRVLLSKRGAVSSFARASREEVLLVYPEVLYCTSSTARK